MFYLKNILELAHVGGADVPTYSLFAHDLDAVELLADVLRSGLAVRIWQKKFFVFGKKMIAGSAFLQQV